MLFYMFVNNYWIVHKLTKILPCDEVTGISCMFVIESALNATFIKVR